MRTLDKSIKKEFARIWETTQLIEEPNENCIRIYRTQWHSNPEKRVFGFQIRTYKPITQDGTGKNRNMVAHVELTVKEFKKILAYMQKE